MIKKLLLVDWSFMRIFRLSLSVFFAINAVQTHNAFSGFISAFLLFQVVTNTGCCGTSGCVAPKAKKDCETSAEIEFEEIKQKT